MGYERSTVTLNAGCNTDPKLKYNVSDEHFYADMVSLDYGGNTYQNPGPVLGHTVVYSAGTVQKQVVANNTVIYDALQTPPDIGIDGSENITAVLANSGTKDCILIPYSRADIVIAQAVGFGITIDLRADDIYLMPNSDDDDSDVEQCNYIFNLTGTINWVIYVRRVLEAATDSGDGLTFNLEGYDAEPLPAPEVWVGDDADSLVLQSSGYTFNYGDRYTAASVTFDADKTGKLVKCTYRSKRILAYNEEPYQFDTLPREQLAVNFLDIGGKSKVVTSGGNKQGPQGVILGWRYQLQDFWDFWREIADNQWHFDVFYAGNQYPDRLITNMFPTEYPDKKHVPQTTPQMVDFAITGMVVER